MDAVAFAQSRGEQMAQVTFAGEMFGRVEDRVMQLAELDLEVAFLGDFQRVLHRVGRFVEQPLHFFGRAQVELLGHIAQAFRVAQQALCADADERVVGVRVTFLDVMNVVGSDQLQPEFLRQSKQMAIDLGLLGNRVVLKFQIKILRAERLLEPVHRGARLVQLVLLNQLGDFAGQTARQGDQTVFVLRQDFLVDARLVVMALEVGRGDEFDEILIAGLVLGQQHQMVINILSAAAGFFVEATAGGDIDLAADDRFDALVAGGLIEIDRAVEDAVIGDGQGGKLQFVRLVDQAIETAGAIEQRILGV